MKSEWDDDNLAKWLEAEADGSPDDGDRPFAALASVHLRRLDAPAGLADRVMATLPSGLLRPAAPVFDPLSSWWVRLTALAAVALSGVGLALVSPWNLVTLATEATALGGRLAHDALASLGAALGVWEATLELLSVLGRTAGIVFTTGLMPVLIAANLAVASAAFVGLRRLLAPREECV